MAVDVLERKAAYFKKLRSLTETYPTLLIVSVDHVGSRQMAEIRLALRGKATLLMGKNTMMRTCLRDLSETNPVYKMLIPKIKRNIGLVFCQLPPAQVRKIIIENKVPAPARQGAIAPVSVTIPAGPTSLDPSQTALFQAIGIATKLVKGQIEILNNIDLIRQGEKVTASQSTLLKKLNIMPFAYGLAISEVWDNGACYNADVLDITPEDIFQRFRLGVQNVAAFSREVGLPNEASVQFSVLECMKNCMALALHADVIFPEMAEVKEMLDNPEKFQALAAAPADAPAATASQAKAEEAKEEEEEDDDEELGFGLFGDD